MITKKQFRWLLIVYFLIILFSIIAHNFTHSFIPDWKDSPMMSTPFFFIFFAIIVAYLTGLIGMFLFMNPSRYIFFISSLCKMLMCSFILRSWDTKTGWCNLFDGLVLFMEGAIVLISIIGPAKHLFIENKQIMYNEPAKNSKQG
ncbi:MAG: hypothetical protein NT106_06800 [Candidatus Sumerlaeota bacterium]|nr:hypothetical protein [Candidatus Sumerlaeota bacterium]